MSASFNSARSAALSFLEGIMAQIPRICKENVENMQKCPEFRAFGDAVARPRLRDPTAAPAQPRAMPETAKLSPNTGMAIGQMPRLIPTRKFQSPPAGTFVSSGSAARRRPTRDGMPIFEAGPLFYWTVCTWNASRPVV